jgi:Na+-transporting methylmalonyl-CoA/oxaloacetate decarboxylase gamma subunit
MAEDKKTSCPCGGIAAIVIAVLILLAMYNVIAGLWVNIVILVLAILIAVGSFAGSCICTKLCKPKEEAEPPAEPPPTQ